MSNLGGTNVSEDTDKDAGGTSGTVTSVSAGTNTTVTGTAEDPIVNADTQNNAKVTTKGDLEGFSTVAARIPVGADGQVLEADSAEALGVKWATPAAGGSFHGALIQRSASLSRNGTELTAAFTAEIYDTDGFVDLGTNDDRITIPANVTKVQVTAHIEASGVGSTNGRRGFLFHKNSGGTTLQTFSCSATTLYSTAFNEIITPVLPVSSGDYFIFLTKSNDTVWVQEDIMMGLEYKDGSL